MLKILMFLMIMQCFSYQGWCQEYTSLSGDIYKFDLNLHAIEVNHSFLLLDKCNLQKQCLGIGDSKIIVPYAEHFNIAKKNGVHSVSLEPAKISQQIMYQKLEIFGESFQGYLILNTYELGDGQSVVDKFFYNKSKGVIFFEYRYSTIDLNTGSRVPTKETLFLKSYVGLFSG